MDTPVTKVVVVGVDGSRNSRAALAWAAAEASGHGYALRAVLAWTPTGPPVTATAKAPRIPDTATHQATAQAELEQMVEGELGEGHAVTCAAVRGPAARVLIGEGRNAVLLVVGARGSSGLAGGLRLGSVSEQVVRRAPCPTVVVPAGRRAATGRTA